MRTKFKLVVDSVKTFGQTVYEKANYYNKEIRSHIKYNRYRDLKAGKLDQYTPLNITEEPKQIKSKKKGRK